MTKAGEYARRVGAVAAVGRRQTTPGHPWSLSPIGVVASGERWPDGSLRPCVEDQLGAACVLDARSGVAGGLSVEAAMALAALASTPDVPAAVRGCVSGRELAKGGFAGDVEVAVQVGVSTVVPVLRQGVFSAA